MCILAIAGIFYTSYNCKVTVKEQTDLEKIDPDYYITINGSGRYEIFTREWDRDKEEYSDKIRHVGTLEYGVNPSLDSLINMDNQ